jgi:hypothetical protein
MTEGIHPPAETVPEGAYPPNLAEIERMAFRLCWEALARAIADVERNVDGPSCAGYAEERGHCGGCPDCMMAQAAYSYEWSLDHVREYWINFANAWQEEKNLNAAARHTPNA